MPSRACNTARARSEVKAYIHTSVSVSVLVNSTADKKQPQGRLAIWKGHTVSNQLPGLHLERCCRYLWQLLRFQD